jgi:hypothetical protein
MILAVMPRRKMVSIGNLEVMRVPALHKHRAEKWEPVFGESDATIETPAVQGAGKLGTRAAAC